MRRLIFLLSVTLGISACGGSSKAVSRELQLSWMRTSLSEFALAQERTFWTTSHTREILLNSAILRRQRCQLK